VIIVGASALALAARGAGVASATGVTEGSESDSPETPITGKALEQASTAALAAVGGGKVTATEMNGDEGMYEVEVTATGGSQTDVQLDSAFKVLEQTADSESQSESSG
jgi:uncharacterized membrane protein YkoI